MSNIFSYFIFRAFFSTFLFRPKESRQESLREFYTSKTKISREENNFPQEILQVIFFFSTSKIFYPNLHWNESKIEFGRNLAFFHKTSQYLRDSKKICKANIPEMEM